MNLFLIVRNCLTKYFDKKDKGNNGGCCSCLLFGWRGVFPLALFPLALWRGHLFGDEEEVVFLASLGEDVLVVEEE